MILVRPSFTIEAGVFGDDALRLIEAAGRTCYKSEPKGDPGAFVRRLVASKHESVLEHVGMTVRFIVDRGVSHELVRHRLASFSQESTRYVNYGKAGHCTFVIPPWVDIEPGEYGTVEVHGTIHPLDTATWLDSLFHAEVAYLGLLQLGWTPQQARSVLPNSAKTEIVVSANVRCWRTMFSQRTSKAAHPQMREVMIPLLREAQVRTPTLYDDIQPGG